MRQNSTHLVAKPTWMFKQHGLTNHVFSFWIIHVGGGDSLTNILFYPHLLVAKNPDINVVNLCYLTST